ncbi:MAG: YoaK family protein, partial [Corynebacterium variabile]
MHTYRRGEQLLAVALTVLAGFVDSVGFLYLGGVFLSFMSGNTTRFATAAVEGDGNLAVLAGSCVGLFLGGVILGALVHRLARNLWDLTRGREAVMVTVTALFGLSALLVALDTERAAMLVLSVGIGALNSVFERDGEVAVPLTYMTGTLVKMGQRLV